MEHALQGDKNNSSRKNPFKILKKQTHISMADYKVSPHTERLFKKNEQLIDVYKNKKA
ncbi:type II toxin-antitoxin system SpoIISB family antitoxin [Bacillus sp. NPDC077027]|uniref:type II toxin-antitoxin system SpoIISB family antitoxin n=1 Tax=Bacillus sp. NPDC077027 TaxID=3390548 RepID=UPI003CFF31E0